MPQAALAYYARHGLMTDPGAHAHLYDDLPRDIDALCRVVQGLMIHPFEAGLYGVTLTAGRKRELDIRPVSGKLARIAEMDERSLLVAREPGGDWWATAGTSR